MSINLPYIRTLFDDPAVERIMIDGWQHVYVDKKGVLEDIPSPFQNEEELVGLIHVMAGAHGSQVDDKKPIASFRLPDGSRAEVIIPPVSLVGPAITIVKPQPLEIQLEDLLRFGTLSQAAADFLRACVEARLNIAVSGGASSGKMSLLNVMARWVPLDERILLLQDGGKSSLPHPRLITLETRPPDREGKGEVTMRDLVQSALRMRPDRIIVMELAGAETFELLNAMNHGHDGCMFSLHAIHPRDALSRIEMMIGMGNPEIPLVAMREEISSAVDLIVHIERLRDGSRKITHICHVKGMDQGAIVVADIFLFDQTGYEGGAIQGSLRPTGIIPAFLDTLSSAGIHLPVSMFTPGEA